MFASHTKLLQRAVFCNVACAPKWLEGITSNTIIGHKSLLHISIIPSARNALKRDKHGFKVACMQNLGCPQTNAKDVFSAFSASLVLS